MRTLAAIQAHPVGVQILHYGVAVVSVLVVLFGYPLLGLPGSNVNFVAFLAAVALSAWYGGIGPGLFATLLTIVLSTSLYLPPILATEQNDPATQTRVAVF